MRQHTLATALQEAFLLSLNSRCRVWAQKDEDVDAPEYERVARSIDLMLQQLTAEERVAAGGMDYDQRTTHYAFAVDEVAAKLKLGYRLEVTHEMDRNYKWQPLTDDKGEPPVYEVIGKEFVPGLPGVREHVRLSLSQVTAVV